MNHKIVLEVDLPVGSDDVVALWEKIKPFFPEAKDVSMWLEEVDRRKIYVLHHEYEGGFRAFSTLEKAIAADQGDYCEEWIIDGDFEWNPKVVWSRNREEER